MTLRLGGYCVFVMGSQRVVFCKALVVTVLRRGGKVLFVVGTLVAIELQTIEKGQVSI